MYFYVDWSYAFAELDSYPYVTITEGDEMITLLFETKEELKAALANVLDKTAMDVLFQHTLAW